MGRIKHPHPPIRLRELRLAMSIGSKELARQANIPVWIIYQIETGNCNPLLHKPALKACAKVLGTTLVEVLRPAVNPVKAMPDKAAPVDTANLPAVIAAPKRRGRPPDPAVPGDTVEISVVVGGQMLGGITTNDLGGMKRVLKELFRDDDAS